MSKIGYTKNKILNMLTVKNTTATEISEELSLNLATVTQHLRELREMGAIEEMRNPHFKKWKYYKLNPKFDHENLPSNGFAKNLFLNGKLAMGSAIVILSAIMLYMILGPGHQAAAVAANQSAVRIAITDPPVVPAGTQALYINYYSAAVHVVDKNGSSGWIINPPQINDSGTLDLLSLTNSSQVIGDIKIPNGSRVDEVSFVMPSAQIVINGSSHLLVLRSTQITSAIADNSSAVQGSEILMQLDPIVVPMYINGITVFVMLSQVGSAVALNANNSISEVGQIVRLSPAQVSSLNLVQPNLTLTNASLDADNGSINMTVTVTNPSKNKPVIIRDLLILGNQSLLNGTQVSEINPSVAVTQKHIGVEFIVQNDSMLQFADPQYVAGSLQRVNFTYPYATSGYKLAPGQSVTLNFSGPLRLNNNLEVTMSPGSTYKISVLGDFIVGLTENVTAS